MSFLRSLRLATILVCMALIVPSVGAQQRAKSTNYQIPADVQPGGGGDSAKSTNYVLDDTIGEASIENSASSNYQLYAGYRQAVANSLSFGCNGAIALGTISINGQATGSGTCVVATDSPLGYSLSWQVKTGSGGTNTGSMINQYEEIIGPFTPTAVDTPDTWSVAASTSEWGARLRSTSTDTASEWGTDGTSDKWLNIRTSAPRTIVSRASATTASSEILQFRVEIGSTANQPTGNYGVTVVMTALSL